jgi:hypothetical protein
VPCDGSNQQRLLARLASPHSGGRFTASASNASSLLTIPLYSASLASADSIMQAANEPATVRQRELLGAELLAWLGGMPLRHGFHVSMLNVEPSDLLVYMESYWIRQHVGSLLPGVTQPVASPSGVNSVLSHLSTLFEFLGRHGHYDEVAKTGNPVKSFLILRFKQGYGSTLQHDGYQEKSAVPLTADKVPLLIAHIDALAASSAGGMELLTLSRDAVLLLYSWHSTMRGTEGGRLVIADFHTAGRVQLFPDGFRPYTPAPEKLLILPTHGTKTNKRSRNHQDPVNLVRHEDPNLCVIRRLWSFMDMCFLGGQAPETFVLRPLSPNGAGFKHAAYSSSSFNKSQVIKYLTAAGIYEGETGHSFRRGGLQHTAHVAGPLAAALQGRIRTPSILARYLDPSRHLDNCRAP